MILVSQFIVKAIPSDFVTCDSKSAQHNGSIRFVNRATCLVSEHERISRELPFDGRSFACRWLVQWVCLALASYSTNETDDRLFFFFFWKKGRAFFVGLDGQRPIDSPMVRCRWVCCHGHAVLCGHRWTKRFDRPMVHHHQYRGRALPKVRQDVQLKRHHA